MLSSDLIKGDTVSTEKYFIFSGFCFVAAFFSDRFIISIGEKVLVDLIKTKNDLNKTKDKLEDVEQKQMETDQALGTLVDNEAEPKENMDTTTVENVAKNAASAELTNVATSSKEKDEFLNLVLGTFTGGKYKFRTIDGIAKELKYPPKTIEIVINSFEKNGVLTKVKGRDGLGYWGLTGLGRAMASNSK